MLSFSTSSLRVYTSAKAHTAYPTVVCKSSANKRATHKSKVTRELESSKFSEHQAKTLVDNFSTSAEMDDRFEKIDNDTIIKMMGALGILATVIQTIILKS
jgi:hypothetical protein